MPKRVTNQDKFVAALSDSYEAMLDAAEAGRERGFRTSKRLLNEIDHNQRELMALARRSARRPTDMSALYEDSVDLARRSSTHAWELTKEFLSAAREAGEDFRGTTRALLRANRAAGQALAAAVQSTVSDLARRGRGQPATRRRRAKAPTDKKRATTKKPAAKKRPVRKAPARKRVAAKTPARKRAAAKRPAATKRARAR